MKAESLKRDTLGSALSILYQQRSLSTEPGGRAVDRRKRIFFLYKLYLVKLWNLPELRILNTFVITRIKG